MQPLESKFSILESINRNILSKLSYWNRNAICIYANQSYLEWIGKSEDDIEQGTINSVAQDHPETITFLKRAISGEKLCLDYSIRCVDKTQYYKINYLPDIVDGEVRGCLVQIDEVRTVEDVAAQIEKQSELKKYHDAMLAKSLQMESILGTISESFCIVDPDWKIRYWNPAAERVTGKSKQQVIGMDMWEVFPQTKDSSLFKECHAVMLDRQPRYFEHFSSSQLWFYNAVYPNEGGGLTLYFRDITVSKNHETELTAIKNNQLALINATKDLMWSVDIEYKLISANQPYHDYIRSITGYVPEPGDNVLLNKITGTFNTEWKELFDRGLSGESFVVELESMKEQITQFNPIYDATSGRVSGVACHSRNTSERNLLEKEKLESAERFSAVVQNGSDLIFILDSNNVLSYSSPSVFSHLGYPAETLYKKSIVDLIHPRSLVVVRRQMAKRLDQKTVQIESLRIRHADNSWRWIEATVDNLLENVAVRGLVINAKDITDRKRKESERELLIKELTRSNSDLKQFSFITSHNLRAPLSNITGLLAFIDVKELPHHLREIIGMIETSAEKLSETIQDLSNILVIKNTTVPTASLDIEDVFHRVNRNFIEAENDIAATIELDFKVSHVTFNESYLESIFINLISNSIKYRHRDRPLVIGVSTKHSSKGTVISFSDNGLGIELSSHSNRLFGMYQRFHPNTEGQGLGLFIIKSQIDAMRGIVEVRSKVNVGTKFLITLPGN